MIIDLFSLVSCENITSDNQKKLKEKLQTADSLLLASENAQATTILHSIDIEQYITKPQIINYYLLYAASKTLERKTQISSAEKALKLFDNEDFISKHKDLYFKTLVLNGDVGYESKNYLSDLNFYVEAKSLIKESDFKNGYILSRFAQLYFEQKDYENAAKYNLKSYYLTKSCYERNLVSQRYFRPEMSLNNAGFCYFKNNQLDSAAKYYKQFE